jgi:hypothetical protein
MQLDLSIENVPMNDYDFGKYYRGNNKQTAHPKTENILLHKVYRKVSIALVAGLILFFAGLMTGIHFESKKIVNVSSNAGEKTNDNSDVVNSADISGGSEQSGKSAHNLVGEKKDVEPENANQVMKKTLMDPENEFIILAKKYSDGSKDRALYYAGVLNKITKDYNFEVVPSIRGKNIKLYVGPMKGKKLAEKMLARVKSIPEFTNSAILYKK